MTTVLILIFRSRRWLDFVLDGLATAKTDIPYRVLVVANDPEPEIAQDSRVGHIHQNPDPSVWFIKRVYAAWNAGIRAAETEYVVPFNSDMVPADGWLDALHAALAARPHCLPTSLLVESGQLGPSAFQEYVRDFGRTPETFDREGFRTYAKIIADDRLERGRLFAPALMVTREVLAAGGYPHGNPGGIPGDRVLFNTLGREHLTAMRSVVYHVQGGEMLDGAGRGAMPPSPSPEQQGP